MAGFAYLHYDQTEIIFDMSSKTNTGICISALRADKLEFGTLSLPFLRYMYMDTTGTFVLNTKSIRTTMRHVLFNPCGTVTHFSWPAVDEIFRLAGYPDRTAITSFGAAHMNMPDPVKRVHLPEFASVTQNRKQQRQLADTKTCLSSYHGDVSSSENRRTFFDVTKGDISNECLHRDTTKAPIVVIKHASTSETTSARFSNVCSLCTELIFLPSTRCRVFPFRKAYLLINQFVIASEKLSINTGKRQKLEPKTSYPINLVVWANAIQSSFSVHLLAGYWLNDICHAVSTHTEPVIRHTQLLSLADTFYMSPWLIVHTQLRFGTSLHGICNAKLTDPAYILFCNLVHSMRASSKTSGGYARKYCIMLQQAAYQPIHTKFLMLVAEDGIKSFDPEIFNVPECISPWVVTLHADTSSETGFRFDDKFDRDMLHRPIYCHIMDDDVPRILDWRRILFLHLVTTKNIVIEVCPTAPKDGIILPAMIPYSREPSLDACRCIPGQISSLANLPDKVNVCLHNAHKISWELLYMIWRRMVRQLQYYANIHCADFDTAEHLRARRLRLNTTPVLVLRLQGSITLALNQTIPNYATYNSDKQISVGADFLRLFTLPNTKIIRNEYMTRYKEHGTSLLLEDNDNIFVDQCISDPSKIILNGQSYFTDMDAIVSTLCI